MTSAKSGRRADSGNIDARREAMERDIDALADRLWHTEELLHALVNHIPDCIARFDADGRHIYVSPTVTKVFGLPREHFIGKRLSEVGKPGDGGRNAELENMIRRAFAEGVPNRTDAQWLTVDGLRFFDILHVPEKDEDGKVVSVLGIAHDVTEHRGAEQTLRENEAFLNALLDAIPLPVFYKDRDGRYLGFNRAYEEFFGAAKEQLIGKSVFDISPRDLAEVYQAKDNELFEGGGAQRYESQVKSRRGELRDVIFNKAVFTDSRGAIKGLIGAILDITQRKRAEDELRASEARFRTFADHATDAFFLHGEGGIVMDANQCACESLGYSREELIGMRPHDFDADVSPAFDEALQARLDAGDIVTFESRQRRKDGSVFPVEVRIRPFTDGGRRFSVSLVRDISERKRVDEDLRHLNRELLAIRNCAQVMMRATDEQMLLDDICRIIHDEAGYRLAWVGYAEYDADMTVRPVASAGDDSGYLANARISWSDDSEYGQGPIGTAIRSGRIVHIQDIAADPRMAPWRDSALQRGYRTCVALPLKDREASVFGGLLIYSAEPDAITPQEIRLMEGLADDMAFGIDVLRTRAERRQAEEALRQSEEKFRAIFQNSPLGIFRSTVDGRFVEVNPAMARMLGYDSPEAAICDITDIGRQVYARPEERERVFFRQIDLPGDAAQYLNRYRRRDGSEFDANLYLKTVRDTEGDPVFFDGIVEDITEHKQAEEEREKLQAQLLQAQKMESVGRLAGGIAHDFNNMLGAITGYAELAMRSVDPEQRLYAHLQEIRKAAGRSADLTRQLLAFARKQPALPAVLDPNQTVEGMLKMLRRLIGEDIRLEWLPEDGAWPVKVDPTQIDQVLANLCVNARDAIDGVGMVSIETRNASFDAAYCAEHPGAVAGDYVLLAVGDDGCGMDGETVNKVFEPFFTTKAVGKGTGLGLATVYGIVKQNGGFIHIDSTPGQGTTVEVYFPRHTSGSVPAAKDEVEVAVVQGDETILVVEDEAVILDMTRMMLAECGYRVLAATMPDEAIRLAEENGGDIDLLITDVIMPGMNGRDLAEKLLASYPGIKPIFMSGYPGNAIAQHGVMDDGVVFIQKPFTMETLTAKVREVLDGD